MKEEARLDPTKVIGLPRRRCLSVHLYMRCQAAWAWGPHLPEEALPPSHLAEKMVVPRSLQGTSVPCAGNRRGV